MESPTARATPSASPDHKLRHFSPEARAAFDRFQTSRSVQDLDPVIFAILEDFVPQKPDRPLAELPGSIRLMDDLGFDSLAMTETVFFTEELFTITIANQEILQVRTLDDLRLFVQRKVMAKPAG